MSDPLDAELDRLFQLPPAELVEARNALADRLKRAGDKAGAARVKAIKRAAPVAWALNQVHFEQPELLALARAQSDALRSLQTQRGVDPRALATAALQQRSAAQAVIDAALAAGGRAGLSENALAPRKVFTMVQAWLAGKGEEPPGRMTQELEASGFDAFAGIALAAGPATPSAPHSEAASAPQAQAPIAEPAPSAAPDRDAIAVAARALAEREQLAALASERARARAIEQQTARKARDDAQADAREAERRAAELRTLFEQRELALQDCNAKLEEARRDQARADEAVAAARAELAELARGQR